MFSDLAATAFMGSLVLAVIAAGLIAVGRLAEAGKIKPGAVYGVRTKATRASDDAWSAGHRAAAPFMQRYGLIVLVCAVLVMILSFVSGMAAGLVHIVGIVFLVLGCWVILQKANRGAASSSE